MPKADPSIKPDPHLCCPNAKDYLVVTSFLGTWTWFLKTIEGMKVSNVVYCPWCSIKLPRKKKIERKPPKLELVR